MFPWPSQAAAYRALQSDAPHVAVADHAGSGKTLAYLAPLVQVQASRVCVPMRLPIVVAVAASILPSRRPLHSCVLLLGAHGSARHLQLNTDIWRCWCRRCGLRKTAASPVLNWLHSCTFGTSHEGSPSPSSECETKLALLVQALRAQEAAAGKPVTRRNCPRLIIITPTEGTLLAQHRKLLLYKMAHKMAHK